MNTRGKLKKNFFAGLVLMAPLVITLFVLKMASDWTVGLLTPVVEGTSLAMYVGNNYMAAYILAFATVITAIMSIGFLAQTRTGKLLFGEFGKAVAFIPLVNTVYLSMRQVASALGSGDSHYKKAVLLEFPCEGVYSVGFVTGAAPNATERATGEELRNVFLPNSPNPTGGRTVLVPAEDLIEVDMGVRKAIKLLVTTGVSEQNP